MELKNTRIWTLCEALSVNGMQAKNAALQKETTELQDLREDLSRQQKELCKQEAEAAAFSADAKVTRLWTTVCCSAGACHKDELAGGLPEAGWGAAMAAAASCLQCLWLACISMPQCMQVRRRVL